MPHRSGDVQHFERAEALAMTAEHDLVRQHVHGLAWLALATSALQHLGLVRAGRCS